MREFLTSLEAALGLERLVRSAPRPSTSRGSTDARAFGREWPGRWKADAASRRSVRREEGTLCRGGSGPRGGHATYHGPGQLIGYLVVNVRDLGPRGLVRRVEQALIHAVGSPGFEAIRRGTPRGTRRADAPRPPAP
ncbi:hypothetical protein ACFZBP_05790 [Streptomyces sp. NPDC008086]|uniref:lipoyl protein ligase domain-containing protein n=1 Tax=Streptomyces sp. NPDC008086 TaxID=3364807 RepID=UPI0036E2C9BF